MAKNHLIEELGPKGRRKVRIGTVVSLVLIGLLVVVALMRLNDRGQLEAGRWTDLFAGGTLEFLLEGLLSSLKAAAVAGVLATAAGFGLALMRMSNSVITRGIAVSWVEIFRGIPLLLTILGVFAVAGSDDKLGVFWSVVVGLTLYNSAVLSEIFRSGVRSLDKGQTEAAQAVGMTYWQTMFLVVLPQAVRRMIPAIVAQMATLTKDVSLGYVVSYAEFVRRGAGLSNIPGSRVGNLQAYVFVGIVYFAVIWALAKLAEILEKRTDASPKMVTKDDDATDVGIELAGIGDSTAVHK